ncbi:hypothetical protein C8P66_108137 [Humitalea rosea]|uniref:Uncharacterized protein n=1 Tax=Humitalea rosea TaxID=990373 RepID=A0A2W7IJP4_9PROT|nr:hypothetical protein [Humitalea rosea]PZW46858.1 hypothetical protein C8P66_108137 [Humitalea rosea]
MNTLAPFLDVMIQVLAMMALAMAGPLVLRWADALKLAADDRVRGYLLQALEVGVQAAATAARARAGLITPAEAAKEASAYVTERVPDALKRLGVSADGLHKMAEARLAPMLEPLARSAAAVTAPL